MNIEIGDQYVVNLHPLESDLDLLSAVRMHLAQTDASKFKPYLIESEAGDNCYLLSRDGKFWSVSYLERGLKNWPAFLYFYLMQSLSFYSK